MALLQAGYTVIELWECEWGRLVDTDEAVQRFLGYSHLWNPVTPFLVGEQAQWPSMRSPGRMKISGTWM